MFIKILYLHKYASVRDLRLDSWIRISILPPQFPCNHSKRWPTSLSVLTWRRTNTASGRITTVGFTATSQKARNPIIVASWRRMPGIIECLALRCAVRVIRDRLTFPECVGQGSRLTLEVWSRVRPALLERPQLFGTVRKRSQVPTTRSISCSIGRRSISVIRTTCWRSISSQIACYFVGAILSKRFNARGSFSRGRRIVFCNFLAGAALILWCGQDAVFLNRRGRAAPTRHSVKSRGSSEFFANCFGLLGLSVALGVLAFVVLFFFSFLSPSASACFCSWSWFFFLEGLWPWEEPTLKMTEDALGVPAVVALSFFFFSFFLCFCSWSSCCSCKECGR